MATGGVEDERRRACMVFRACTGGVVRYPDMTSEEQCLNVRVCPEMRVEYILKHYQKKKF
jgi:hypothetical protein